MSMYRLGGSATFQGVEIRTSRWLTVSGEPGSATHRDWRERYMRNEGRWRAGVHRIHQRPVRMEPLWYTPQVPDHNVYEVNSDGKRFYVAHPETIDRASKLLSQRMDKEINEQVYRALLGRGF